MLTDMEKQVLITQVADIATHLSEFPQATPTELQFLNTIDFLCMAIMTLVA